MRRLSCSRQGLAARGCDAVASVVRCLGQILPQEKHTHQDRLQQLALRMHQSFNVGVLGMLEDPDMKLREFASALLCPETCVVLASLLGVTSACEHAATRPLQALQMPLCLGRLQSGSTHMPSAKLVVVHQLPQALLVAPVGAPPDRAAGHKGEHRQAKAAVQAPDALPLYDLQYRV